MKTRALPMQRDDEENESEERKRKRGRECPGEEGEEERPTRKEENSRISRGARCSAVASSLSLGCSRVSTWSSRSFSPRPSICLALQTSRSIIPRLGCNEISQFPNAAVHTRRHADPYCRRARVVPFRSVFSIFAYVCVRVCGARSYVR